MAPAKKQKMAVRVPEGNMAQKVAKAIIKKIILWILILLVIAKIKKATEVEAMPIPKFAASL